MRDKIAGVANKETYRRGRTELDSKSSCPLTRARGFESHRLRQEEPYSNVRFFYFCHKGVAGIVFPTQRVLPKPTQNYLWLNRDKNGTWIKTDRKSSH